MSFLRLPRQVMQSLSADARSTLDLVPMMINRLQKLCERGEAALNEIDITLTAATMKSELDRYRAYLAQEPAVIAAYLNPQIPKTAEPDELATLKQTVPRVLQRHYSEAFEIAPSENNLVVAEQSLFRCLFGDEYID
jgi:hypothetical protein